MVEKEREEARVSVVVSRPRRVLITWLITPPPIVHHKFLPVPRAQFL